MAQQTVTQSFSCCFRMTPRTCSERLPAMRALSAQLCSSTIVGFIELRECRAPKMLSRMLTCLPSRTLRAIAARRCWRRGCPALPNRGLVKSLAGQGANLPAESRAEIIRCPFWPLAPVAWRESHEKSATVRPFVGVAHRRKSRSAMAAMHRLNSKQKRPVD